MPARVVAEQGRGFLDFWHVLAAAIALVFIIEGMLPFISPDRWRKLLAMADQMEDRAIRNIGLGSMVFGVIILYLVH
jgi:uncharacterized protein YjeT (DUF2065 family)